MWEEDSSLSVSKDSISDIMGNLKFKAEDSDILRFYPMVEYEILGTNVTPPGTPSAIVVATTPKGNVTTGNVTGNLTVPPTESATPTPTPTVTEPGFEAIFAIAGLLAVAFLVLRQRK